MEKNRDLLSDNIIFLKEEEKVVQSPKFLFNIVLMVVCSQFVFADDANTDGKQMYISFEDAQAALP